MIFAKKMENAFREEHRITMSVAETFMDGSTADQCGWMGTKADDARALITYLYRQIIPIEETYDDVKRRSLEAMAQLERDYPPWIGILFNKYDEVPVLVKEWMVEFFHGKQDESAIAHWVIVHQDDRVIDVSEMGEMSGWVNDDGTPVEDYQDDQPGAFEASNEETPLEPEEQAVVDDLEALTINDKVVGAVVPVNEGPVKKPRKKRKRT